MKRIRALKESWNIEIIEDELAEKSSDEPILTESQLTGMTFTPEEYEKVKLGVIPNEMEDKWFIYWENDTVYCHRSWGGECAFVVKFAVEGEEISAVSVKTLRNFIPQEQVSVVVGALLYYLAENPARQQEYMRQYEDLVLKDANPEQKDMGSLVCYIMFGLQILRGLDGNYGEQ